MTKHWAPYREKTGRSGRALTTGRFATRAKLEEEIVHLSQRGYPASRIAPIVGINVCTVLKILRALREEGATGEP